MMLCVFKKAAGRREKKEEMKNVEQQLIRWAANTYLHIHTYLLILGDDDNKMRMLPHEKRRKKRRRRRRRKRKQNAIINAITFSFACCENGIICWRILSNKQIRIHIFTQFTTMVIHIHDTRDKEPKAIITLVVACLEKGKRISSRFFSEINKTKHKHNRIWTTYYSL